MRTSFTQPAAIRRARHQQPAVRAILTLLRPAVGAARAAVAVEAPGAVEEASKTQAAGRGKGDAAAAGAKPKYQWIDASEHDFTPRYEWDGEELPWLDNTFDGMTLQSAPHESNTPRVPCKRSLNLQPALESRRGSSDVAPHAQCGRLRGRASDVRGTNGRTHAAGMPSGNGGSRKACGDRPWALPMRHVPEPSR